CATSVSGATTPWSSEPCENTRSGVNAGIAATRALLGQRRRPQHEAVAIFLQLVLEPQRPTRHERAVAVGAAHAVERAEQRRAAAGLALVEQRALLAAGRREVAELDAHRVQRDAPRE